MAKRRKGLIAVTKRPAPAKPSGPTTRTLAAPVAQPEPTPDPSTFKIKHPSDDAAYKIIDQLNAKARPPATTQSHSKITTTPIMATCA